VQAPEHERRTRTSRAIVRILGVRRQHWELLSDDLVNLNSRSTSDALRALHRAYDKRSRATHLAPVVLLLGTRKRH
jgi:hypothetical protein